MSDLSLLQMQGLPPGGDPPSDQGSGAHAPAVVWPAPDAEGYPSPAAAPGPERCRIEGNKGHQMQGRLAGFDPERLRLWLLTPVGGAPMALMFNQFRRLTLLDPVLPVADGLAGARAGDSARARAQTYVWTDPAGTRREGRSVGARCEPYGVFLFEPDGDEGALRRSFVPHSAIASIEFGDPGEDDGAPSEPMGLEPTTPRRDAPWLDDDRPAAVEALVPMDIDLGTLEAAPAQVEDVPADGATADAPGAPATVFPNPGAPRPGRECARPISSTSFERTQVLPPPSAVAAQATGAPAIAIEPVSTPEALDRALAMQSRMPLVRIGEALLAMGSITADQLQEALQAQRQDHSVPLGEMLVRRGVLSRETLRAALARKMGYPVVAVDAYPVDTSALVRVPHAVATRLRALPLGLRGGRLVVAMEDPTRRPALEELEFVVQASVVPVLAQHAELPLAISRAYGRIGSGDGTVRPADDQADEPLDGELGDANELLASLEQHSAERGDGDERPIEQSDNSLVRLINQMIVEAQSQGVSDIHVECPPGREKVRIRFRKDGQLRLYLEVPHTYRAALIARLKIMCDLDISERRKPQDGKIAFGKFHPGSRLELRLATIPTSNGLEDAVLRLLASAKLVPLDKLGLSPANLEGLKSAVGRPYGMVLCVGPTGSGKTTTLHSALGWINKPERKIWTAEDPIEITQPGLRQVQVNAKIDWTFAKALRTFLRADPDVVMVGEIRDGETAQVAIEASLTGHLVLSTLHTNSAAETVTRLLDMGMDPFNFADSLLAVLAQRLLRRLCPKCVQTREANDAEVDEWLDDYLHAFADRDAAPSRDGLRADWTQRLGQDGRLVHHHAPGCPACDGSGLKGRAAIQELLLVSRELRRLIQTGGRAEQILAQAQREGMRTLRQDGIEKVIAGVTSIEEVRACSNA